MSKIFAQVMLELIVKHHTSSAYHPESQGALERFHQTLKAMLHKFCTESNQEWDEGLPLSLFTTSGSLISPGPKVTFWTTLVHSGSDYIMLVIWPVILCCPPSQK